MYFPNKEEIGYIARQNMALTYLIKDEEDELVVNQNTAVVVKDLRLERHGHKEKTITIALLKEEGNKMTPNSILLYP